MTGYEAYEDGEEVSKDQLLATAHTEAQGCSMPRAARLT